MKKRLFRLPWRSARQIRRDVDDELGFHLDMRVDALIAAGLSPDAARAQAIREFGDIDDARRYIGAVDRDIEVSQRRSDYMNELWQDIVYAARKLRAAPAFTLAAIVTLALGIGANTAIFSIVNGVLLQPLPFPNPDQLVRVRFTQKGAPDAGTPMDIIDYRTRATSFDGFSVVEAATTNLVRDGADAERVLGVRVNANYFNLLRATPLAGRFFTPAEDASDSPPVVVLSDALWRRSFGSDPAVVGKTVRINSATFTVIGVARPEHRYPITAELWLIRRWEPNELSDATRGARWLGVLARVKDGVALSRANAEVNRISVELEKVYPEVYRERRARLTTVQEFLVGDVRRPLYILLGAVGLVLLIACANVANLMLVRATAREGEMAIRTALGAGRGRLARQLITESVLLSLCGAAVGLAIAKIGMTKLLASAPPALIVVCRASIDATALAVTALVALLTGIIFGVLPATQIGRADALAVALKAGARGTRLRPAANRTKRAIVIAEVGLAVVLLTGAGLLLNSFTRLLSVDPGFRSDGALSMKVALPWRYDSTKTRAFMQGLVERTRAIPGVTAVGISNGVPLDGSSYGFTFTIRGRKPMRESDEPSTEVRVITPGFFEALGLPLMRGRGITDADRPGAAGVLVVNRAFADRFFPNEDPIGQAVSLGWGEEKSGSMREIVGIVGNVHSEALSESPEPTVYAPAIQVPHHGLTLIVRANGSLASLATPLRAIARDLDREIPVYSVQTMEERVASSVGRERFFALLLSIFAGVALVLSAVGLYGVIAYAVSQRTHELGVRVALGATADGISRMVIREGLTLTGIGSLIGAAGALATARSLETLLFGVNPRDPMTLIGVVVVLALVSVVASWMPARRAARVDPLVAMRGD
jgi:predicted permease